MKQTPLLLLVALFTLVQNLFAQQGKAVITGEIMHSTADSVEVITYPNPLLPQEVETVVKLDGNRFRIEVPLNGVTMAEFWHGSEMVPVYLEPGYELDLKINGNKFLESIRYKGKGANENNYLAQYTHRFDEEEDYQVLPENIKLQEKGFTEFLNYRRQDQLKSLKKYMGKKPVSDQFKAYVLAEINFSYANDKLNYHNLREQILMSQRLRKPSAAFYDFLNELDLQSPANLLSAAFISFLQNYTAYYAKEAGFKKSDKQYYQASYDIAAQKLQDEAQLVAQAHILRQSIQFGHLKYTEEMLQDYTAKNKSVEVTAYLNRAYDANKEFVIGSRAPDFRLKNVKGDSVSLSDFRGRVVYLSFWRSTCALCVIEQPHLSELSDKLKGENVVFLNVALVNDENEWRRTISGKQLQGEHLYTKDMDGELAKRYNLKDVPAYFIIDYEGNFISLKARHPNDREIMSDIRFQLQSSQIFIR
jgi:peroxiredoxin